jgi:hypothetical protein
MRQALILAFAAALLIAPARADDGKKARYPKSPDAKGAKLVPDAWKSAPNKALTPAQLDALVRAAQKADNVKLAPLVGDDLFIRRVTHNLTGRLPGAREAVAFIKDRSPDKRKKLIDKLLDSEEFALHQARYWRDVMLSRATDQRVFVKIPREVALETWLKQQFEKNTSWSKVAREMITSEASLELLKPRQGGSSSMLFAHTRDDGPVERTNDVARVFLGINISCAQCHDHPDDIWKRQQFHEMAAYFGKLVDRVKVQREPVYNFEMTLTQRFFGEYRMPDQAGPKKTHAVQAKFLLGGGEVGKFANDKARRKALADAITAKDNYYFAAAFVNRAWGQMLGQAFVQPVDSLGPLSTPVYGDVLVRLADHFRATGHDVKAVYRLIANSEAYQRQSRAAVSMGEHVKFAGTYPTRLRPDALWMDLNQVLGPIYESVPGGSSSFGMRARSQSLSQVFKEMFAFDPSLKAEDVEGSVPQALMLMNNKTINALIKADGKTALARVLKAYPKNETAVEVLYLHAMGRRPSAREKQICLEHIASLRDRGAAFEDILWSLINSAEFRLKR